jgi:hypothetical protein
MMEDGISFDVLESLFLMNESLHKADLSLTALSKHESFDPDKIHRYSDWIKNVRAATNAYLMGVIQKTESEVGVRA